MREIKFRSIIPSVENPKEFYTVYYSLCSEIKDTPEHIKYMLKKWLSEGNNPDQYTGVKDLEGRDIFEGDIVALPWINKRRSIAEVVFDMDCGQYMCRWINFDAEWTLYYCDPDENLEVIGNIYENPELLEDVK